MTQDANCKKMSAKSQFLNYYIVFILCHIISYTGVVDTRLPYGLTEDTDLLI